MFIINLISYFNGFTGIIWFTHCFTEVEDSLVKDGLKAGERIVISKLSTASNGIKVNPVYK